MSKKKCPFRKRINYMGYHDGNHNAMRKQPESTYALEEFEDCIEIDCAMWVEDNQTHNGYCGMRTVCVISRQQEERDVFKRFN